MGRRHHPQPRHRYWFRRRVWWWWWRWWRFRPLSLYPLGSCMPLLTYTQFAKFTFGQDSSWCFKLQHDYWLVLLNGINGTLRWSFSTSLLKWMHNCLHTSIDLLLIRINKGRQITLFFNWHNQNIILKKCVASDDDKLCQLRFHEAPWVINKFY